MTVRETFGQSRPWWAGWRAGVVVVAACVGLLAFTAAMGVTMARADQASTPAVGAVVRSALYLDTDAVSEGEAESVTDCAGEGEPCFNPCTMGEPDPQTGRVGPCDLTTPLPYGRSFAVHVMPGASPSAGGVSCDGMPGGAYFVAVTVWVVDSDGQTVAGHASRGNGCVSRGGLPVSADWVAELFVTAAQGL